MRGLESGPCADHPQGGGLHRQGAQIAAKPRCIEELPGPPTPPGPVQAQADDPADSNPDIARRGAGVTRLIVSHSSRLDDVPHRYTDDDANWCLLGEVCDRLKARYGDAIQILVDRDGLISGDDWNRELNLWLAECQEAILLVSKRALERWSRFAPSGSTNGIHFKNIAIHLVKRIEFRRNWLGSPRLC